GTIQNELARTPTSDDEDVIVMHGSGFIDINLTVYQKDDGEWFVEQTSAYRTQRRLFDGQVYMPVSKIPNYSAEAVPEAAE
ncbi:MAG TPA: hypothetical protein DCE33_14880, partial [Rhodospirillaceae bacterium]|nr:hypothetical protein [Rhodospirillaceae bacterium]